MAGAGAVEQDIKLVPQAPAVPVEVEPEVKGHQMVQPDHQTLVAVEEEEVTVELEMQDNMVQQEVLVS
jgi:hypothetical protein